jgi:hypothetical protein
VTAGYPVAAPVRTAADAALLDDIDARVRAIACSMDASEMHYPSLIARGVLERAEYPQAFPHLLLSASRLNCDGTVRPGAKLRPRRALTGWCLSPAVCYHAYAELAGRSLERPVTISARGTCFRGERETSPGIRQIEFAMREIVFAGPAEWVDAEIERASRRVEALATSFGLRGEWRAAEDPFFLPRAEGKALMQRLLKVKLEYQSLDYGGLALASVNRHGPFFSRRFQIGAASGDEVHTACVAVGLDRWSRHAGRRVPAREDSV